jgi:hypothetical protein
MTTYKGDSGHFEVTDTEIVIVRSGLAARAAFGKDCPDRHIPLGAVAGVRFKEPGRMTPGWLRLVLGGEQLPADFKPKIDDPDAMFFQHKEKDAWTALAQWLEQVAAHNNSSGYGPAGVSFDAGSNARARTAATQAQLRAGTAERAQALVNAGTSAAEGVLSAKSQQTEAKFLAEGVRPDIAAAAARMGVTFGAKREIRRLQALLLDGEQVRELASGRYADKTGVVALTDRRLLIFSAGMLSQDVAEFPVTSISSISTSGTLLGKLTVHASGNIVQIEQLDKGRMNALAKALREPQSPAGGNAPSPATAAPAAVAAPAPAVKEDPLEQLKKLGELHDAGVLTDEEFATKKAELLSRL